MFEQIYGAIQTRSGCRKQTWVKITRTDFMEMSPSTNQVKTARREEPERTASATATAWCSEVTCNHGIVLENKERKVKKKNSCKIKPHPGVNQSCRCWIEIWFVLTWRFSEPWIDLVTTILVCLVFKCRLRILENAGILTGNQLHTVLTWQAGTCELTSEKKKDETEETQSLRDWCSGEHRGRWNASKGKWHQIRRGQNRKWRRNQNHSTTQNKKQMLI